MTKKKKPYYPNYLPSLMAAPADVFTPIPFDEFMEWKIGGYEIPSSINSIIREKRLDTGEVTEYVYNTPGHAKRKAKQIMDEGVSEFVVCTSEAVHHLYPESIEDYDDPLA